MFTEEVMSDEHEGAALFPQGGLQKGPVQLDYRLHSNCRRKKGEGKETPNRLTQTRNSNPKTREKNGEKREGQEKKEENATPLSSSSKRDVLIVERYLVFRQVKGLRCQNR